jgi:Family of unknown function (DUF6404)
MTHSEKLTRLYEHLPSLGLPPYTAAPPLYRLLWRLGVQVAPPIFGTFLTNVILMGGFFAFGYGLCLWLFLWSFDVNLSPAIAMFSSIFAGLLFGIIMAWYFRYKARQLKLPLWSQYTGKNL